MAYRFNEENNNYNKNKLFELKPIFNPYLNYLRIIPYIILIITFLYLYLKFIRDLEMLDFSEIRTIVSFIPLYILFIFLIFVFPLLYLFKLKQNYEKTTYYFYKKNIFYVEGFFQLLMSDVRVEKINKIVLDSGLIQKYLNLGNIIIILDDKKIIFEDIPYIDGIENKLNLVYNFTIENKCK